VTVRGTPDRSGAHAPGRGSPRSTGVGNFGDQIRGENRDRGQVIRVGGLRIDLAAHEAWIDGARVDLTAKEYELLRCLASEPTRVLTKVNFELPKTEGSQESKYSGSGRDW